MTSPSSIRSKVNQIKRLEQDIVHIDNRKNALEKKMIDSENKFNKIKHCLNKEELSVTNNNIESGNKYTMINIGETVARMSVNHSQPYCGIDIASTINNIEHITYDAFISHASEDKESYVRPLVKALESAGHKIWYDEFTLEIGDSLRRSIDHGLINSKYGIIVLSKSFFNKKWPRYELDGLVSREMNGQNVILPIWHNVTQDQVLRYSPSLADKVALNSSSSDIAAIARNLCSKFEKNYL